MPPLDLTAIANFGFAALVAGFVLVRLENSMRELRDEVKSQTQTMVAQEIARVATEGQSREAVRENTATLSRLADAINRVMVNR